MSTFSVDSITAKTVRNVMYNDNTAVSQQAKALTQSFIDRYKYVPNFDLRTEYNNMANMFIAEPANLIYFLRAITLEHILISYRDVPEFRNTVKIYSGIVRQARNLH